MFLCYEAVHPGVRSNDLVVFYLRVNDLAVLIKKGIHIELLPAQGLRPYEHDLVTKV